MNLDELIHYGLTYDDPSVNELADAFRIYRRDVKAFINGEHRKAPIVYADDVTFETDEVPLFLKKQAD